MALWENSYKTESQSPTEKSDSHRQTLKGPSSKISLLVNHAWCLIEIKLHRGQQYGSVRCRSGSGS